jgi:hypothetical protein
MRRTPVVLGVLSMVFGGLTALWTLASVGLQSMMSEWSTQFSSQVAAANRKPGAPDPELLTAAMHKMIAETRPYTNASQLGVAALSIALLVVGIGLYKRQLWSRPASLAWAGLALLWIPFMLWVQLGVVLPHTQEMMAIQLQAQAVPNGLGSAITGVQKGIAIFGTLAFYAPFPIVLAALMGRGSAKNDLQA